jgi:stringent starvation protein B
MAEGIAQQPYFLRALYEWCVDSGYTPHISVLVDGRCKVPAAFVKEGQIVLNIGPSAVRNLNIDNEWVVFSARFSGVSQDVNVPVDRVQAIYARETGEGMAFQPSIMAEAIGTPPDDQQEQGESEMPKPPRPTGRPTLKVVK